MGGSRNQARYASSAKLRDVVPYGEYCGMEGTPNPAKGVRHPVPISLRAVSDNLIYFLVLPLSEAVILDVTATGL